MNNSSPKSDYFSLIWINSSLIISAVILPCTYSEGYWPKDNKTLKAFNCKANGKFEVKDRKTNVTGIKRKDPDGYPQPNNYNDPSTLNVQNTIMWYIPKGINTYFSYLIELNAYHTGLKELKQDDMKQFPFLLNLDLQENKIEIIEKDLFKFNPNLKQVSFYRNLIKFIDKNVFDDLKDLIMVNLLVNDCIHVQGNNKIEINERIKEGIKNNCQEFGSLEQSKNIKKTGTERGRYFWILVGCGIIVAVFVIGAVARIVYGIIKNV